MSAPAPGAPQPPRPDPKKLKMSSSGEAQRALLEAALAEGGTLDPNVGKRSSHPDAATARIDPSELPPDREKRAGTDDPGEVASPAPRRGSSSRRAPAEPESEAKPRRKTSSRERVEAAGQPAGEPARAGGLGVCASLFAGLMAAAVAVGAFLAANLLKEPPAVRAVKEARAASSTDAGLAILEREGVARLPRADVQAIRARAAFDRGNQDEAKLAISQGEKDEKAAPEDAQALQAIKGLVALRDGDSKGAAAALAGALASPASPRGKDPLVLASLAYALVEQGDTKAALPHAERAIALDAGEPRARSVLAHAALLEGDLPRALKELEQARGEAFVLVERAVLRTRLGDFALALKDLDAARSAASSGVARSELPLVALARSDALLLARDVSGARAEAETARALGADPIEAARALARVACASGRYEDAEKLLDDAANRPGAPQGTLATERAAVLAALGSPKDAAALLERFPSADDPAEAARRELSLALVELASGNDEHAASLGLSANEKLAQPRAQAGGSAIVAFSRFAVPASGLPARALALAARAKELLGKADEAKDLRARAKTLAPNAPDLLVNAAERALATGDLAAATRAYEEAIAAVPDQPDLEARLGAVQVASGRFEEAQASFEKALRSGATDPLIFRDLARALLARGKKTEAEGALERARENGLDLVLYIEMRRDLARAQGRQDEVRSWLERLVAARPDDLATRRELADFLAATNPAAAEEQYEGLLKLDPVDQEGLRAWVRLALDGLKAGTVFPGVVQARLKVARARLPEDRDLRALSGRFLLQLGKTEEALAELEGALEGAKVRSPDALLDRAVARMRLPATTAGQRDMIAALSEALSAADPKQVVAAFLKEAQTLALDAKQRPRARVALEALTDAAPRSREARVAYLNHLSELKDFRALKSAAEQALRDFPQDNVFFDLKALAEKELGK